MTIWLLDDDPDEKDILRDAFTSLNIQANFRQVLTVTELLGQLEESTLLPDILFLDVNLPRQNGIEAIGLLKNHSNYASIPIIMYSNADDDQTIKQCFDEGASAYLTKTSSFQYLITQLDMLLSKGIDRLSTLPVTERIFQT